MQIECPRCSHQFSINNKTSLEIGNINEKLFHRINQIPESKIKSLWIVSPFLSQLRFGQITLKKIGKKKELVVITKPKETVDGKWHGKQFDFLQNE